MMRQRVHAGDADQADKHWQQPQREFSCAEEQRPAAEERKGQRRLRVFQRDFALQRFLQRLVDPVEYGERFVAAEGKGVQAKEAQRKTRQYQRDQQRECLRARHVQPASVAASKSSICATVSAWRSSCGIARK